MFVESDVYVSMRDGVGLAVDLYRPEDLGLHAAVLIITPYRKDAPATPPEVPLDSRGRRLGPSVPSVPSEDVNPMLAAVRPLVDAGFVVAVADARGTGYSEGVYDYYNLAGGHFDGYDLVEWIAAQPWCTGKVGIMGASAAAIYCYITALTSPPHLFAMAPNTHPGDFYFDQWRVGGVFRWDNRIGWSIAMAHTTGPIDPGDPGHPSYERKRAVYAARFDRYGERIAAGKSPVDIGWLAELYQRGAYDDHWRHWSFIRRASEITIPTLHGGVWFDHFIRGTLTTHDAINVPKRLFVGPGSLMTRPDLGDGGLSDLTVDWFARYLRGDGDGPDEGPAARLYLMGREDYVDVPTWPVPATETDFFLRTGPAGSAASLNDGALTSAAPAGGEDADVIEHDPTAPNSTPADVFDQRPFEKSCLTYTSAPLDDDLTVIGAPRLLLYASTDAADVDWCVRLCGVDETGRSKLLNTGAFKGSHVNSHEHPEPLVHGKVYCFVVEIWAIANLFKRGHRIRLDISTSDFPFFESNPHRSRSHLFHDRAHPSRLVLPIVKPQEPSKTDGKERADVL